MPTLAADETAVIPADAVTLWHYRLDFTNLPGYNADVHKLQQLSDGAGVGGSAGVGALWRFTLDTAHGTHEVRLTVTAVVENEEVSARMDGSMTAYETFRVATGDDGTVEANLSLWLDLPEGIDDAMRDAILANGRVQIRKELDGMVARFAGASSD